MLYFKQKVSLFSQSQICHHESCAILGALIIVVSVCRFYMKFLRVFPWQMFCMQVQLISPLESKEQLICFRVYAKSATYAQRDGDG